MIRLLLMLGDGAPASSAALPDGFRRGGKTLTGNNVYIGSCPQHGDKLIYKLKTVKQYIMKHSVEGCRCFSALARGATP